MDSSADPRNWFERQPLDQEIPEVIALARKLVAWYLMNGGTDSAFVACRTWDRIPPKTLAEKRADNETLDALERLRELIGRDETIMRERIARHNAAFARPESLLSRRQSSSDSNLEGSK